MQWALLATSLAFGLHTVQMRAYEEDNTKRIILSLLAWSLFAMMFIDDVLGIDGFGTEYLAVAGILAAVGAIIVAVSLPGETSDSNTAYVMSMILSGGIILLLAYQDQTLLSSTIIRCSPFQPIPTFSISAVIGFVLHACFMDGAKWQKWLLLATSLALFAIFAMEAGAGSSSSVAVVGLLLLVVGVAMVVSTIPAQMHNLQRAYAYLMLYIGLLIFFVVKNETALRILEEIGCYRPG